MNASRDWFQYFLDQLDAGQDNTEKNDERPTSETQNGRNGEAAPIGAPLLGAGRSGGGGGGGGVFRRRTGPVPKGWRRCQVVLLLVLLLLLLLLLLQLAVGVEPTGRFREAAVQRRHLPWNRQRAKLGKINDEHTRIPIFQKREFKNFLTDFFTPSYPIEEIVCAMTIKLGWYI